MAIVSLPLPIQLLNGTLADAGQVMTDLNSIASNVNANAAKNGVNDDITALNGLTSIDTVTITNAAISGSMISDSTLDDVMITNSTIDAINNAAISNCDITGGTIKGAALDATCTVPTAPLGTNTTQLASCEFVINQAFNTALPVEAGKAGQFVTTDGVQAFWAPSPPDFVLQSLGVL